jgi:hypothetical protein
VSKKEKHNWPPLRYEPDKQFHWCWPFHARSPANLTPPLCAGRPSFPIRQFSLAIKNTRVGRYLMDFIYFLSSNPKLFQFFLSYHSNRLIWGSCLANQKPPRHQMPSPPTHPIPSRETASPPQSTPKPSLQRILPLRNGNSLQRPAMAIQRWHSSTIQMTYMRLFLQPTNVHCNGKSIL